MMTEKPKDSTQGQHVRSKLFKATKEKDFRQWKFPCEVAYMGMMGWGAE